MQETNRLNFFLVGAPKSGTTFMYNALRQHPEVFLPNQKELHYFAPDLYPENYISEKQYFSIFKNSGSKKIIGEASVWYLYSEKAAELISKYNPDARILIMLRNPVDMLKSLHNQMVFDNWETFTDFEAALDNEASRKGSDQLHTNIYSPKMLRYSELGKYSTYVEKYLHIFGKDKVHIILHDDLIWAPDKTFVDLLKFLNISTELPIREQRDNTSKEQRYRFLSLLINPGAKIKSIIRPLLPFKLRRKIVETIVRINSLEKKQEILNSELQFRLRLKFAEDTNKLEKIINKDLSIWKN